MEDTLSRKHELNGKIKWLLAMISLPNGDWVKELRSTYDLSIEMKDVVTKLSQGQNNERGYQL